MLHIKTWERERGKEGEGSEEMRERGKEEDRGREREGERKRQKGREREGGEEGLKRDLSKQRYDDDDKLTYFPLRNIFTIFLQLQSSLLFIQASIFDLY